MDRLERRVLIVMISFLAAMAWPMAIIVGRGDPAHLQRVFGFDAGAWAGWLVGALVAAAYAAHSMRRLPLIGRRAFDVTPLKALSLPFGFVAATVEEVYFRRELMDWAQGQGLGPAVQVVLAALAFGVVHAVWGVFGGSLRAALNAMAATTALGAALAIVYLVGGRAVAPCIWSHAAVNLALEPWLLLAVISHARRRGDAPVPGARLSPDRQGG